MPFFISNLFKSLHHLKQLRRGLAYYPISPAIPSSEFQQRRSNLVDTLYEAFKKQNMLSPTLCIIPSSQVKFQAFHVPYPFRQDSTFLYFTGFPAPKSILAILFNSKKDIQSTLFIEQRSNTQAQWEGPGFSLSDAQKITGIHDVRNQTQITDYLESLLSSKKPPLLWMPDPEMTSNDNYHNVIQQCFLKHGQTDLYNLSTFVDQMRVVKSAAEIVCLDRAAEIIYDSHWQTMLDTRQRDENVSGVSEYHIGATLDYQVRVMGNTSLAYPPVIAGGSRANTIHYLHNNQRISPGELVLVDAGADYFGYSSDVTRTWPIEGKFSNAQKVLYEIVLECQSACSEYCSPECSLDDLHSVMMKTLGILLKKENVLSSTATSMETVKLCPHHIGHYLGMDVHDAPTVSTRELLKPNVVFTLEPGLYIPENCSFVPKDFHGIGIRIEDDFVMQTDGSVRTLGGNRLCPKTVSEIEQNRPEPIADIMT